MYIAEGIGDNSMDSEAQSAQNCNCCNSAAWEYSFSERGFDLGRCAVCGLYYVSPMPTPEQRHAEVNEGRFAGDQIVTDASVHLEGERRRTPEFDRYAALLAEHAPRGRCLEVGCGTGALMKRLQSIGFEVEGIELTADRRALAAAETGATVHGQSLEELNLRDANYAAITLIYVFSHLTDPASTLADVHRLLVPGGVVLLRTSEIGPGVTRQHAHDWNLGDHLYFLGDHTIERYASNIGFELLHRERVWEPLTKYNHDFFRTPGRSRLRNAIKKFVSYTPGALPLLRAYVTWTTHRGNPAYSSTIVLRKPA